MSLPLFANSSQPSDHKFITIFKVAYSIQLLTGYDGLISVSDFLIIESVKSTFAGFILATSLPIYEVVA